MRDVINDLAAEAAASVPDVAPYTYAAQDALAAQILVVEEGGFAFPRGSDIGAPGEVVIGEWSGILDGAGFRPGTYSWWNAIPYGLDRQPTAEDKRRGRDHLSRATGLHTDLQVVLAVGAVAQTVVKAADPVVEVLSTRSPVRASAVQREEIRRTFERARMEAHPLGLDPDG